MEKLDETPILTEQWDTTFNSPRRLFPAEEYVFEQPITYLITEMDEPIDWAAREKEQENFENARRQRVETVKQLLQNIYQTYPEEYNIILMEGLS